MKNEWWWMNFIDNDVEWCWCPWHHPLLVFV
jgi:hypothetical protein